MPEIGLSSTELFQNIAPEDLDALLKCLDVRKKHYQKGEILFLEGAPTSNLGIVLSGRIMIEMGDAWGGRSILGTIGPGGTFAEAYACIPGEPLLVTVSAAEAYLDDAPQLFLFCINRPNPENRRLHWAAHRKAPPGQEKSRQRGWGAEPENAAAPRNSYGYRAAPDRPWCPDPAGIRG